MRPSLCLALLLPVACASGPTPPAQNAPAGISETPKGARASRQRRRRHRARPDDPPLYGGVVGPHFARSESAHFATMDPLMRSCTIRAQAQAGARWISVVTGQRADGQGGSAAISLAQRALDTVRGREMGASDLANLAWYVAEATRRHVRGRYQFDRQSQEIVISPARLRPLQLAAEALTGRRKLTELWNQAQRGPRGSSGESSCEGVAPADMARLRALAERR